MRAPNPPGADSLWPVLAPLREVRNGAQTLALNADAAVRARIGRALGLEALESLAAGVEVSPWLDGAVVDGRWTARVVQTCGVSLEPFATELEGAFTVRVVPPGSVAAQPADGEAVEIDPEAEDPPDVLEGEAIDVGAYVVEHLALEIDPFPRKPGAEFEPPPPETPPSPFAVLARLKRD